MIAWWHKYRVPILATIGFLAVLVVGGFNGWMSWGHIVHVGHMLSEPSAGAYPLAIDGMMMVGAIMAWIDNIRGYKARVWSIVALWLGSVMTLGFNLLSAAERGWQAMLYAMVPAIAFLVTVENVFHPSRRLLEAVRDAVVPTAAPVQTHVETPVPADPPATTSEPPATPTQAAGGVPADAPAKPQGSRRSGGSKGKATGSRPARRRPPHTTPGPVRQGASESVELVEVTTDEPVSPVAAEDASVPVEASDNGAVMVV